MASLFAGMLGMSSAAAATPAAEAETAAAIPMHGSGYSYHYHSEFARPQAVAAEIGANDTVTNSALLAARLGQVRRALSGSEVRGVAPQATRVNEIPGGSRGGTGAGERIPSSLRDEWFPDGQTPLLCSYCRTRPATALDHVEPRVLDGDLTPGNITPACTHCNSSKGPRMVSKTPPAEYVGPWPPPHWPERMQDWWQQTYGGGS